MRFSSLSGINMKAVSPLRSERNVMSTSSEHILGISRSKSPMDDPLSLLYNMNDCYTMLKELVPSLPQNKNVSKMEILQHVIDYILDLQIALDSSASFGGSCQNQQRLGQSASSSPLIAVTADTSILTFESSNLPKESEADESTKLIRWHGVRNWTLEFPPLAGFSFHKFSSEKETQVVVFSIELVHWPVLLPVEHSCFSDMGNTGTKSGLNGRNNKYLNKRTSTVRFCEIRNGKLENCSKCWLFSWTVDAVKT